MQLNSNPKMQLNSNPKTQSNSNSNVNNLFNKLYGIVFWLTQQGICYHFEHFNKTKISFQTLYNIFDVSKYYQKDLTIYKAFQKRFWTLEKNHHCLNFLKPIQNKS